MDQGSRQSIALYIALAASFTLLLGVLGFIVVVAACLVWVYK